MSMAIDQLQQQAPPLPPPPPPPISVSGKGSFGPVIAVVAVITVLGIISILIGRLCTGRRVMGRFQFDFEGWIEKHCSSCINGNTGMITPGANASNGTEASVSVPIPEGNNSQQQQTKPSEESSSHQNPPPAGTS